MSNEKKVIEGLCQVLADSYTLYLAAQNYHWNVVGPHFSSLHAMFQDQYEELAEAIDEIAEAIRTFDVLAPGSYQAFQQLTQLPEPKATDAMVMVADLLQWHGMVRDAVLATRTSADEAGHPQIVALMEDRMQVHDKTMWMLKSTLSK